MINNHKCSIFLLPPLEKSPLSVYYNLRTTSTILTVMIPNFLVQFCGLMKEMLLSIFLVELDKQHLSCLLSFLSVEILLGQHKSCAHL
jgi:hypothetical protein